ncbi:MAG: sugar phosphate isomerase/epimerase [Planctomycetes bacterium]|nr:sugar phosphate isomerase/epimerase [Planctomycetota bacterium]
MIQLAFSTNAYTKFTLPEACDRIAAAGYRAVEVLADSPHAWPPEYSEHQARRLRERLDSLGLRCVAVNGNTAMGYFRPLPQALTFEPSLISPSEVHRQDRLRIIRRVMALANVLGAPVVTVTGGRPGDLEALGLPVGPPDVLRRRLLGGLEEVVRMADLAGVEVALEPEPGQFLETTADLAALLDEVDHPRLGANLDVGHARCAGDDPAESARVLGRRLKHLHLEDIQGRRHYHLIPGLGEIDFAAIRRALDDIGYAGAAAVELYTYADEPDRAAAESLTVLRPLFPE